MLDGLADGSYALHLSGSGGLTDLAGNGIVGNDPSGDYVISFQVVGPQPGISGNMIDGYTFASGTGQGLTQDLGTLSPHELQAGFTVIRGPESGPSAARPSTEDGYLIRLLQSQDYSFTLSGDDLPAGAEVTITNASGQVIPLLGSSDGQVFFAPLSAGTYTVVVGGWTAGQSASVSYQLTMDLVGQQDNAPPLVDGPAPLLQIHLDGIGGTTGTAPTGNGGPGSSGGGGGGSTSVFLSAPGNLNNAQSEAGGGLASLGMNPLGGVAGEAGPATAPQIQVALSLAPSPILSSLVSLTTMTQVISWNRDGEGVETVNPVEQPVAAASDEPATIDQAESPGQPNTFRLTAQPGLTSNDRAPVGRDIRPSAGEEAMPASRMAADVSPSPGFAVDGRDKPELAAGIWVKRMVITGAILAAAFRGRRAIKNLDWKKTAHREQPRSAGPIGLHPPSGSSTVTWLRGGPGIALPHGTRRDLRPAGSSHHRDAR